MGKTECSVCCTWEHDCTERVMRFTKVYWSSVPTKNVARSRCSSHCSVLATEPHQAIQNTSLVHSNDCFDPITMIYQLYRKLQTSNGDVLKKTWSSGDSPATFWWFSCDVTESCLCNWRTPTQATAKKQDWKVVVWALVPFVRITWMLLCSLRSDSYVLSAGLYCDTPAT